MGYFIQLPAKISFIAAIIIGSTLTLNSIYISHGTQSKNKIPAGTLLKFTTETGFFYDTSFLYLTDGSVITVYGSVSKWRKGMEITHPEPDGATVNAEKYWCIEDTCLRQK